MASNVKENPGSYFWCLFFEFSVMGWRISNVTGAWLMLSHQVLMYRRGFGAQVYGAMIGVPQFRQVFGYMFKGEPGLPASWRSAFNKVSSVGQFFGCFVFSWPSQ